MVKKALFLFFSFLLLLSSSGDGKTLQEIIEKIGSQPLPEIKKEIEALSQEEKLKLQLLLLLFAEKEKTAEELLKKLPPTPKGIVSNVIELPPSTPAIVVDKDKEILYLLRTEKGVPMVVRTFPCITGKRAGDKLEEGDQRTPEGIYFPLYWNARLPETYGIGAFPLNYPNLLDRKILKRNGHGIWIHGTNNPNRPPHSSNGCIVLKNEFLKELRKELVLKKTPVIIVSKLSLSSREQFFNEKKSLINFILHWKKAWENSPKNIDEYLNCYSKRFVWKKGGITEWKRYKRRITKAKKWIKIDISNIVAGKDGRILEFGNLYVVNLDLDYRSNNFKSKGRKILYIIKEEKSWRILGEENL